MMMALLVTHNAIGWYCSIKLIITIIIIIIIAGAVLRDLLRHLP